jgi:DNA-binding NarL/FixJ family response regulator
MSKIKIMVADDHSIIRYGLCSMLKSNADFEVVAEATQGKEAVELYDKLRPHVVILDISMPDINGVEICKQIRKINPEAIVLIMTVHLNEEYLNQVMSAGASGYLLKNSGKAEIESSVYKVMNGEKVFSKAVSELMTMSYLKGKNSTDDFANQAKKLTRRELQILALVVEGKKNHAIADILFISPRTVESHRANLMQKLNVNNTATLVRQS